MIRDNPHPNPSPSGEGLDWLPLPRERAGGEGARQRRANQTLTHARTLRRDMTDTEHKLWSVLRNRAFNNLKFKRQVPVGVFIADFMCHEAMLIVELDGGQHAALAAQDARRTHWLEAQGFQVLRFWNNEVMTNIEGVCAVIGDTASARCPHPPLQGAQPATSGCRFAGSTHASRNPRYTPSPPGEGLS